MPTAQQKSQKVLKPSKVHAFKNDVLGEFDAVALAELIKAGEVSSKEVVLATIERARQVDPLLNAIVTDRFEESLTETKTNIGFFEGLPTFIKDMTHVEGLPSYYGSEAFSNPKPAKKSDPIIEQMKAIGFAPLGCSSMSEFGFTCSTEFNHQKDTRNPWNINHTPGGSSGGSAALVASGVVPLAHAADGGGSIRIPAAACGLVGLKPSRGRLLKSDLFKNQPIDIAIDGVLTRSVRDTAYFYAEAEKHFKNPKLPKIGLVNEPTSKVLNIGYTTNSINGMKADECSSSELLKTVQLLESLGHIVRPVALTIPDQFVEDFANVWAMNAFFIHRFGKVLLDPSFKSNEVTQLTKGLSKSYLKNCYKTPGIAVRMKKTYHQYSRMFEELNIDLFLTPTIASSAPEIGYFGMNLNFEELFDRIINWTCFTPYANASGGPSISLPLGFDQDNGLPIGMLFWANHGQEKLLLELALQLEEAQPWRKITED
ncbi:amidase [Parvicella tangerina]|uniref:Amidase AmiC n=1 Tax=Parvicella tangerina TaxID=2829795 RepID=A0A916N9L3_9FLAO|nr:amidase [Parvicella tangerina]CAG5079188.1 Putative amidase AmiC [Parvicella tangerina]